MTEDSSDKETRRDPLIECIGEFGRWQLLMTFLLSMVNLPCTFHLYAPTFLAAEPEASCSKPLGSRFDDGQWQNLSQVFSSNGIRDICRIRNLDYSLSFSDLSLMQDNGTVPCESWDFEYSQFGTTIITEWNLVCDRSYLRQLAELLFLVGVAVGGFVSGLISDRFGRKQTLMVSLLAQILIGMAIAYAPWFPLYLALRTLLGFFCVSVVFSGFVLCMELVGGKWLTISGVSYGLPVPVAYIIISGLAYMIRDWRQLQLAITLPSLAFLPLWWVFPESPRWLLAMRENEQAITILKKAANFNGKQLPDNFDKIINQDIAINGEEPPNVSVMDLFRTSYMRRLTSLLYVACFCAVIIYFGLVLNLANLGGDIYVNSVISGLVEFPAALICIIILLKMGRRWPTFLTAFIAGFACLSTAIAVKGSWLYMTLVMVGRLSISATNMILKVFSAELFPTAMRNMGVGSTTVPSGISLLLVPYLWALAGVFECMPLVVLGFLGIIGGGAVLFLPEPSGLADDMVQS
ncbi:organic cation transporter protein [Halyomorpha halys]|uniref:organic cation transporter protein n=1 Tax=Halyomorpha halys TaxID=286706 RepID=UPI0006D4D8F7|nr:organic cation transporter protein [Halyomorpha halys]